MIEQSCDVEIGKRGEHPQSRQCADLSQPQTFGELHDQNNEAPHNLIEKAGNKGKNDWDCIGHVNIVDGEIYSH